MLGELLDVARSGLKRLTPPTGPDDGPEFVAWRYFVAGSIVVLYGGLATHIALACGFMTALFPGFAKADGQSKLQSQVTELRLEGIETKLWDLRIRQCEAWSKQKPTIAFTEKIRETQRKYAELTNGHLYELPDCRELQSE